MRLWVTGVGVVSPLGIGAAKTATALFAGERSIRPVTLFDASGYRSEVAASVEGLDIADVVRRLTPHATGTERALDVWSRTDAMAALAGHEALAQARLDPTAHEVGLVIGGTTAGMFETEGLLAEMSRDESMQKPSPQMLTHPLSATADRLQETLGPFADADTICSACAGGASAIIVAASRMQLGGPERMLVGGADALCRLTYAGFSCLGALSPQPCVPFSSHRDGLTLGEAAAFLVLETARSAKERGVKPLAELRGWAQGAEAHHITNPEASGRKPAALMRQALARAELSASDIGYVNAHGTATKLNDAMELAAIRDCFGEHAAKCWVSSTKAQVGHTLGAAGALEAVFLAWAIERQQIPGTAGLVDVADNCGGVAHSAVARAAPLRAAMSNSFGFGGTDAVLVMTRPGQFQSIAPPPARRVVITGAATIGPLGLRDAAGSRDYAMLQTSQPIGAAPSNVPVESFDPTAWLDVKRARRIDRTGRLVAVTADAVLKQVGAAAGSVGLPASRWDDDASVALRRRFGVLVGSAYGRIDQCASFVLRLLDKGPRFASPAAFPNLLPSSAGAHASIYLGTEGPVLAPVDLGVTAEKAVIHATELIATGVMDAGLAGAVEERCVMIERVLSPLRAHGGPSLTNAVSASDPEAVGLASVEPRGESVAVIGLESAATAAGRPLAEVVWSASWRGEHPAALAALPSPLVGARVVTGQAAHIVPQLLGDTPWRNVPVYGLHQAGTNEANGGLAIAAAVGWLESDECRQVLVVGTSPDRCRLLLLASWEPQPCE